MAISRAELVAAELLHTWRQLALAAGVPSEAAIRHAHEAVLELVAQHLLADVFGGLLDTAAPGRYTVAHRWRFAAFAPITQPAWPVPPVPCGPARYVIQVRPTDAWTALPVAAQRSLERALELSVSTDTPAPPALRPVGTRRLPQGDFLVTETLLAPPPPMLPVSGGRR